MARLIGSCWTWLRRIFVLCSVAESFKSCIWKRIQVCLTTFTPMHLKTYIPPCSQQMAANEAAARKRSKWDSGRWCQREFKFYYFLWKSALAFRPSEGSVLHITPPHLRVLGARFINSTGVWSVVLSRAHFLRSHVCLLAGSSIILKLVYSLSLLSMHLFSCCAVLTHPYWVCGLCRGYWNASQHPFCCASKLGEGNGSICK